MDSVPRAIRLRYRFVGIEGISKNPPIGRSEFGAGSESLEGARAGQSWFLVRSRSSQGRVTVALPIRRLPGFSHRPPRLIFSPDCVISLPDRIRDADADSVGGSTGE